MIETDQKVEKNNQQIIVKRVLTIVNSFKIIVNKLVR